ncbi:hypothetical protein B0J18DRAFT_405981 [Chaetomium sp. MPI-SDFR-AT-0129]|nr:hypothetical protein B0J18DRAFT_405981 [Chaetomium sp. MPI-SDFR-AT-0129]
MGGLIPLMLGSGSRTSLIGAPSSQPQLRRQSTGCATTTPTTTTTTNLTSTSPTIPTYAVRPRLPKRLSLPAKRSSLLAPARPAPIPILPYTNEDWRKTIAEVKRKYFGKRYRACSARCLEVLDGIKDTSEVEPVYLIYLHFYAATSLEICARPLPSTTGLRATLLQQARSHFEQASILINAAEESVLRKFRPGSVGSSRDSTCLSPSESVPSRAWTPDTSVSSPTDSICSFDDLCYQPRSVPSNPPSPPKRVKKVSFSLPKDAAPLRITVPPPLPPSEPIIRPDSPTLGFEEDFFRMTPVPAPVPDLCPVSTHKLKFREIELPPLQTIHEHERDAPEEQPHRPLDEEEAPEESEGHYVAESVTRACEHLTSLRNQLRRHSTSLDQLLQLQSQSANPNSNGPSYPASAPQSPTTSMPISVVRRLSLMSTNNDSAAGSTTEVKSTGNKSEDARFRDRQARIERLRLCGWQRKRFDGRPYEELCGTVLAEIA